MQPRGSIRLIGTLMFLVNDHEAYLVTQRPKRNTRADHEMWPWFKESIVGI